jgi:transposase
VTAVKIVRPICCGIDVHKSVLVATIASTGEDGVTSYEQRSFSTLNPDLARLRDWLLERGCPEVCMESTGKYWIPVFNALEGHVGVAVVHPKYVRAIKGKKTDRKDSRWIADLFRHDLVRTSFIPPRLIRECREIARYRAKLVGMRSSERNRYQNCMTVSNIGLGSVLTDCMGVTARAVMGDLASGEPFDEARVRSLVRGRAKAKADLVVDAVRGCRIDDAQRFKISESLGHMERLDEMIAACEAELRDRLEPHRDAVALLCTIPGVSELSAMLILSEAGTDMSVFEDAAHFASWAGLAPGCDESAGKRRSSRTTRAGQYLKPVLVQCALASTTAKAAAGDYFAAKYRRLRARRGHKRAVVAVARMMAVCIWHMLSTGEVFSPSDLDAPGRRRERRALTEQSALELLRGMGYDITAPEPAE